MCDLAARLVDRVLPASVPVRQWVLSLPFELRGVAAFEARVPSAFVRIFVEAVVRRYRGCGRALGIAKPEAGAVTFVQRFGSSLNLNVHMHVVFLDGVFDRDEQGRVRFHDAHRPRAKRWTQSCAAYRAGCSVGSSVRAARRRPHAPLSRPARTSRCDAAQ